MATVRTGMPNNLPHKYFSNVYYDKLLKKYKVGVSFFPPLVQQDDDSFYVIKANEAYKPEKISRKFYGTPNLWWVICFANGFKDTIKEFHSGRNILIPSSDYIFETYLSEVANLTNE